MIPISRSNYSKDAGEPMNNAATRDVTTGEVTGDTTAVTTGEITADITGDTTGDTTGDITVGRELSTVRIMSDAVTDFTATHTASRIFPTVALSAGSFTERESDNFNSAGIYSLLSLLTRLFTVFTLLYNTLLIYTNPAPTSFKG